MSNNVNVIDFGAEPDGKTDCSAAFQAAYDAAARSRRFPEIPAGIYRLDRTIVLTSKLAETDREYIDRLKLQWHEAKRHQADSGNFIWGCIFDPSPEESERHHRLVEIAEKELAAEKT